MSRRVRVLWIASTAHALFAASIGLLLLLPVLLRGQGASRSLVGVLMGLAALSGLSIRPAAGWALDRWGRRPVILAGGLLSTAACATYLLSSGIDAPLIAARLLMGLADGILFAGFFTLAADLVPADRRAHWIALFGISGMLPITLAPAAGEWIVARGGFQALFLAATASAGTSLAVSFALPKPEPVGGEAGPPLRSFIEVARRPGLAPVWLLTGSFGLALAVGHTFAAPAAKELGAGPAGIYFAVYGVTASLLRLLAGRLPDRWGAARVAGPCLVLYAGSLLFLGWARSPAWLAAAGVLGGIGHGFIFPSAASMAIERTPARVRGTAMALVTGVMDLCFLLAPPALGRFGDLWGYPAMFGAAAALTVAGFTLWLAWERPFTAAEPVPEA